MCISPLAVHASMDRLCSIQHGRQSSFDFVPQNKIKTKSTTSSVLDLDVLIITSAVF